MKEEKKIEFTRNLQGGIFSVFMEGGISIWSGGCIIGIAQRKI